MVSGRARGVPLAFLLVPGALALCAFALGALGGSAAARADEPVRAVLPAGDYVRPGRPLVVRVSGGAERVRAGTGPWALPQGERGDEFVLQVDAAPDGRLDLEVDLGTRVEPVTLRATLLDGPGPVRATFGDPLPGVVVAPRDALPTVREAWLPFDSIDDAPEGASPAARDALAAFRELGPDGSGRAPWFEPLTFGPGIEPFRAMAEVERSAPRIPRRATVAAALCGAAALLLLAVSRSRRNGVRLAWTGAPVAAFLAWTAFAAPLPGAARATAATFVHDGVALVIVRVSAVRACTATIPLPPQATSAAQIRFSSDDPTSSSVATGREVRLRLRAGEHRLIAYAVRVSGDSGGDAAAGGSVSGAALRALLASWRLEVAGAPAYTPSGVLPEGSLPPCVAGVVVRVAPGK